MGITTLPKFMPEDGSAPKGGKFACRTCKQWFASSTGRMGHARKNPDHQLYSLVTGEDSKPWRGERKQAKQWVSLGRITDSPTNGHHPVTTVLLQSAFAKLREEVTAELDRLEAQLFPTSNLQPPTSRRTYVAR